MKVLVIGGGQFGLGQAQALAAEGLDVIFAAVDLRSIRRFRRYGITHKVEGNIDSYSITNIPLGRFPVWVLEKVGNWELWKLYKHIFRDGSKPDVIHAHFSIYAGLNAVSLARRIDRPLVITEHSSAVMTNSADDPKNRASCRAWKAADRVIAVSNPLARKIHELSGAGGGGGE